MKSIDTKGTTWTYGAEHELADWDTRKGWGRFGRDPEPNICNSNGIAADPSLKFWPFGAEINTPPSNAPEEQGDLFMEFLNLHKNAKANWRTGFHVHIRIPGLKDSLPHLKLLARYILDNYEVYDLVDPLPIPNREQYPIEEEYKAARKRYNWMRMSHFTVIPEYRVANQLKASSIPEFFNLEVPMSKKGKPLFHAQPRAGVNLRQLLQTDTIEFRHFPQAETWEEVVNGVRWCRDYLLTAFSKGSADETFRESYTKKRFPRLERIYEHRQELRWRATTPTKNPRSVVEANIKRFLAEDEGKPDWTKDMVSN